MSTGVLGEASDDDDDDVMIEEECGRMTALVGCVVSVFLGSQPTLGRHLANGRGAH